MALILAIVFAGCARRRTLPTAEIADPPSTAETSTVSSDGYVSDDRCVECHEEISASYAGHSMGRSLQPVDEQFQLPTGAQPEFEADGFRYSMVRDQGTWYHRQSRLTQDGSEMAVIQAKVSYVVGSGNHGCSFLVDRDGYLFMSPMTWYPDEKLWQLSPGYETRNSQFNRPVVEICLYCHSNRALHQANTLNHYEEPVFRGHAIGCQRCHGPGASHIQAHESGTGEDGIVNPAKLAPELREAVCQQCHLSGLARVNKAGKQLYDYRPGQPLNAAFTIFTETSEDRQFVGHVEQMYESACFQGSDKRLGCVSCHDPHRLPTPETRVAYYRDRCLDCHRDEPCSLSLEVRTKTRPDDSCIDCHMPNQQTEVRHAASTDHSIPRMAGQPRSDVAPKSLHAFPSDEVAKPTERDLAIGRMRARPDKFEQLLSTTAAALEKIAKDPNTDDLEALEALVELYVHRQEVSKAVDLATRIVKQSPNREPTLRALADIHVQLGNFRRALPYWKRAIETNPHMPRYWYQLGRAYAATDQWYLCQQTMQAAKQRFPTSVGVRQLLVESHLRLGDVAEADKEFGELERFQPLGWEALRDWYQSARKAPPSSR